MERGELRYAGAGSGAMRGGARQGLSCGLGSSQQFRRANSITIHWPPAPRPPSSPTIHSFLSYTHNDADCSDPYGSCPRSRPAPRPAHAGQFALLDYPTLARGTARAELIVPLSPTAAVLWAQRRACRDCCAHHWPDPVRACPGCEPVLHDQLWPGRPGRLARAQHRRHAGPD